MLVSRTGGASNNSAEAAYVAMCHFLLKPLESFMAALMQHAEELQGDLANYTDVEPVIQVSEVLIFR